jgi:signal peptidase I
VSPSEPPVIDGGGEPEPNPYTPLPLSRRPAFGCLLEIVETLVLTFIIFFVIQNFVAQPYKVEQQSMQQTLEPEQYVLVDKLTVLWASYDRGEIIVFNPPPEWNTSAGQPFIKRIIGVAGDDVEIRDDGFVYVNGIRLEEPYVYPDENGDPQPTTATPSRRRWTVPEDQLFVMGDHRSNSADSRTFGPIPTSSVVGRAWLRYWPFEFFGVLETPAHPELATLSP